MNFKSSNSIKVETIYNPYSENLQNWESYWNLYIEALKLDDLAFSMTLSEALEMNADSIRKSLKDSLIIGGVVDDKLVGIAKLIFRNNEKLKHKGELGSFFVLPSYRHDGIGTKLLGEAISLAKQHFEFLRLYVNTENSAVSLYKKFGFSIYAIEKYGKKNGNSYVDEYVMQADLR